MASEPDWRGDVADLTLRRPSGLFQREEVETL